MRRALAITIVLLFGFSLTAPLFAVGATTASRSAAAATAAIIARAARRQIRVQEQSRPSRRNARTGQNPHPLPGPMTLHPLSRKASAQRSTPIPQLRRKPRLAIAWPSPAAAKNGALPYFPSSIPLQFFDYLKTRSVRNSSIAVTPVTRRSVSLCASSHGCSQSCSCSV